MRALALVVIAAVSLAACEQQTGGTGGGSGGGQAASNVFPNLFQTAYRAEANITNPENGQVMPVVMIRDGHKMRMEMSGDQGQTVIIVDPDSGENLMISNAMGRQVAMRVHSDQIENPADVWARSMGSATFAGPCAGAGQTGTSWAHTADDGTPETVCVTGDGIILKATHGDRTTWETTSVQRGPQAAALFQAPAGVQVMDLGGLTAQARAAAEAAQKGH